MEANISPQCKYSMYIGGYRYKKMMTGILSVCVGAQLILLQQCEAGNDFVLRHQERIVQIHETDSWP